MVSIEYHADLKEVQSDVALAELLGEQAQTAPFDRLAWWQGLEEHCGLNPMLAVARHRGDLAVLPLAPTDNGYEALANWYTFRFRPLISRGADGEALMRELARGLAGRANHVALSGIPEEDGSRDLLERAFREAGWTVFADICDTNHILCLKNRTFAEYLETRPGRLRATLKRKAAKVECAVLTRFYSAAWEDFETVYAQSWKPREASPAFLRQFAEQEGAASRLRLGIAQTGGTPVAAQMWTVERGTAFIHKLAYVEAAKAMSPGTVLSAAMFEHAIDRDRVDTIDFGTGDDGYKRDWMEEARPRYRFDMYRPGDPANWLAIARASLARLARRGKRG